jgi:hypothetical protein
LLDGGNVVEPKEIGVVEEGEVVDGVRSSGSERSSSVPVEELFTGVVDKGREFGDDLVVLSRREMPSEREVSPEALGNAVTGAEKVDSRIFSKVDEFFFGPKVV